MQVNQPRHGDISDCLRRIDSYEISRTAYREQLAALTGVSPKTVHCWLSGRQVPRGLNFFVVCCWLVDHDVFPTAFYIPSGRARQLFRLLGWKVVTPEIVRDRMRFSHVRNVFTYARGTVVISSYREYMLTQCISPIIRHLPPALLAKVMS